MAFPAQELADQAELFAALTGVTKPNPWDMFFLVMGRTGSGKSTFIGRCTGKPVTIGHGLYSCTNTIDVSDYHWNGRRIFLIDTPGFNDTKRPDVEILEALASSLSASYANGVRIHGVILLQPMSDNRMSGSSLRSIEMMKAMCGFARYDNLAIVTTMWPASPNYQDQERLEARYDELSSDARFFGGLVKKGATVFRYNENGHRHDREEMAAAQSIVAHLIRRSDMHPLGILQLQREIVVEGKTLGETAAGSSIAGYIHRNRQTHQKRLREVEDEMQTKLAQRDARHLAEMRSLKKDIVRQTRRIEEEKKTLQKSLEDMHREGQRQWKQSMAALEEQFRVQIKAKEQELRDKEDLRLQLRKTKTSRSTKSRRGSKTEEHQDAEQDRIVGTLREEVSQVRDAHKKINSYRGHIVNGATNGIAAGLTGGAIAGKTLQPRHLLVCDKDDERLT